MGAMKHFLELISAAVGKEGEITKAIIRLGDKLNQLMEAGLVVVNPLQYPIAIITAPGDRSVGIWPHEVQVVGLPMPALNDPDFREQTRKDLTKLFRDTLDDVNVWVRFNDECGECRQHTVDGKCKNPKCVCNSPSD